MKLKCGAEIKVRRIGLTWIGVALSNLGGTLMLPESESGKNPPQEADIVIAVKNLPILLKLIKKFMPKEKAKKKQRAI